MEEQKPILGRWLWIGVLLLIMGLSSCSKGPEPISSVPQKAKEVRPELKQNSLYRTDERTIKVKRDTSFRETPDEFEKEQKGPTTGNLSD